MAREIELEEIETAAFKDRYGAKAMPAPGALAEGRRDGLIACLAGSDPSRARRDLVETGEARGLTPYARRQAPAAPSRDGVGNPI